MARVDRQRKDRGLAIFYRFVQYLGNSSARGLRNQTAYDMLLNEMENSVLYNTLHINQATIVILYAGVQTRKREIHGEETDEGRAQSPEGSC